MTRTTSEPPCNSPVMRTDPGAECACTALSARLRRAWRNRFASPRTTRSSGMSFVTSTSRSRASVRTSSRTADATSEDQVYTFYYDLKNEDFVAEEVEDVARDGMLPMTTLLDDEKFPAFQRRLEGRGDNEWIRLSTRLSRPFQKYRIPIVPISTDDLDLAAKTFDLLNKQGSVVSDMDMIHALTYSPKFELRGRIQEIQQEILSCRCCILYNALFKNSLVVLYYQTCVGFGVFHKNSSIRFRKFFHVSENFNIVLNFIHKPATTTQRRNRKRINILV